jgi:quinol monooxygenase YgiN
MAVLYEVTLRIDPDVEEAYLAWLHDHVDEMLAIDGFVGASMWRLEDDDPRVGIVCVYELTDREALATYVAEHAPRMRGDGLRRFDGKFTASRRILHRMMHAG